MILVILGIDYELVIAGVVGAQNFFTTYRETRLM